MGDACSKAAQNPGLKEVVPISKLNFNNLYAIGRGGFGKVWRVEGEKEKE